jgi:transposase
MAKISTLAIGGIRIFKDNQLTIALDLRDRTSRFCVLDTAGEIMLEQELPTTRQGFEQLFSEIPRTRTTLESGTHSPWVSRELIELPISH